MASDNDFEQLNRSAMRTMVALTWVVAYLLFFVVMVATVIHGVPWIWNTIGDLFS